MINRLIDENILDQESLTDLLQYLEFDDKEESFRKFNDYEVSEEDVKDFLKDNPLCLYKERSTYNLCLKKASQNLTKKVISPENNEELMSEVRKALCVSIVYLSSINNLGIYNTNDPLVVVTYLYRDSGFYRSFDEIGEEGSCYDDNFEGTTYHVMENMAKKMENLYFKMDFNQLYLMYKAEVKRYHEEEFLSF